MSDMLISPAEAKAFYQAGMEQFDHLLLGEQHAKLGVLASMVMGENIMLVGPPGGGKTTLAQDSFRIVEGIEEDRVAKIPPLADLTPQQLVGGHARTTKEITKDGETSSETTTTKIDAIIKPDTQVLFTNEINRVNPLALNASLEVLESGVIYTTAGTTKVEGLEYGVATMNPAEARQGVFPITAATASRHSLGSMLGTNGIAEGTRNDRINKIMVEGWEPRPDRMQAVVDLQSLHKMRRSFGNTPIPTNLHGKAIEIVKRTVDGLRDHQISESDARLAKQIGKTAKVLAFLGAQERVDSQDLVQAARYIVTARLGALSRSAYDDVKGMVDTISR